MWGSFTAALACGGFVCDPQETTTLPVAQNAERIAFSIEDGWVEAQVQVFYEGPEDAFAWIVPVPAEVEIFVGTDALFDTLERRAAPMFQTISTSSGDCAGVRGGCGLPLGRGDPTVPVDSDVESVLLPSDTVTVVSQGQAGPYDYTVVDGSDAAALTAFLAGEGYSVDSSLEAALQPYLTANSAFLAIRLQSDSDVGDISPIGFRYPGDRASIPLRLTRIAAVDDMLIQVNVLGATRAVSSNYLHAILDEAHLDWNLGGENYYDLVARAADEAGGHAVVTDYAGPVQGDTPLWRDTNESLVDALAAATDELDWYARLAEIPLPETVSGDAMVARAAALTDLEARTAALDQSLFDSLRRGQAMLDLGTLTRMSTTLDPQEMTLDPIFALNPDAPVVDRVRQRTVHTECQGNNVLQTRSLSDGRTWIQTDARPASIESDGPVALRIEAWGPEGEGEVLVDHTDAAFAAADTPVQDSGCSQGSLRWAPGLLVLLLSIGATRRRRVRSGATITRP